MVRYVRIEWNALFAVITDRRHELPCRIYEGHGGPLVDYCTKRKKVAWAQSCVAYRHCGQLRLWFSR